MTSDNFHLPSGPSDLCFDTGEFMKESFSADDFLHNYRNAASLEQMRDDLGLYLKVLRSAMIELINQDYQDFVNLSTELVDLDKRIDDIRNPILQLREEIVQVQGTLTGMMNDITESLQQKRSLRMKENAEQNIQKMNETVIRVKNQLLGDYEENKLLQLLERLALDVIHLEFVIKLYESELDSSLKDEALKVKQMLLEKLKHCLLLAIERHDEKPLEKCLKIYFMLNEVSEAEHVFRKSVVVPKMNQLICETNLQNHPKGLVGIYDQIIEFMNTKMTELMNVTQKNAKLKCFNFLLNSFWTEVEQKIELNMNSIFAPGNPDQFHQKFTSTLIFLETIENKMENPNIFKNHPQYKSFMVKWNLMVYFQIRFQEIGAILETVCCKELDQNIFSTETSSFKLLPFETVFTCISKSWSDGVYLPHLFSRFLKLSLQFISRLGTWIDHVLEKGKIDNTTYSKVDFLMLLYVDIFEFERQCPALLENIVQKAPKAFENQRHVLEKCFNESKDSILSRLQTIEVKVADDLIANSLPYIKQVNDIPRLYRKTNRDIPNKNCSYVEHTLAASKEFHSKFEKDLGSKRLTGFLQNVFSALSDQYYSAVNEVLTSVQKTEESLRRLKNLRERSTTATGTPGSERQGMSDDDKIRLQLQVDVIYWVKEIQCFGVPPETVTKLTELSKLVEEATKIQLGDEK